MIGMNATTGRAITGIEHLYQSISNILQTPIGTRIMRRNYGSYIQDLIDQPLHGATVLRLYAATATALMLWEPRIRLSSVQLNIDANGAATLDLEGVAAGQYLQLSVPVKGATA